MELRRLDWADTIARHWLYETADAVRIEDLAASEWAELAGLARKIQREEAYHRLHADMWVDRLAGGAERARLAASLEATWPYALGILDGALRDRFRERVAARLAWFDVAGEPGAEHVRGTHTDELAPLWDEMTDGAPLHPGCAVVTAEGVWAALAELPDPEIPVISLVDLGVVRDVAVDGERVTIEFTPTFLGCPALEVMRDRMADAVRNLGGTPDVRVVLDDSWSTDRITPEGRAKLREAGFAPPAPPRRRRAGARAASGDGVSLPVLRVGRDPSREPVRADPVPLDPLLRRLPAAVRAVQDHLTQNGPTGKCSRSVKVSVPALTRRVAAVIKSEGNDSQGG